MAETEIAPKAHGAGAPVANPFVTEQSRHLKQSSASADVAVQRELAEVQAAVMMARRFPRDPGQAMEAILRACTRASLAEGALYSYSRGGTDITGPSIRLAEAMAQAWSNLAFGIRELEQRSGESTIEAYCWDMETNVRQSRVFQVRHQRHTRTTSYALTDPRDIYEQNANQGARRLRACILGVIPGDVVEAAVLQCETTLKTEADTSPEGIRKLVEAFAQFSVTREQIELRCQRRMDAIRPAQIVQLRKIWASLRDEMSAPGDWFEIPQQATGNEALRQGLGGRGPEQMPSSAGLRPKPPTVAQQRDPAPDVPEYASGEDGASEAGRRASRVPLEPDPASTPDGPREQLVPPLLPEGDAPAQPQGEGAPIEAIKPVRLRRGGWDWELFANQYVALARSLPRERLDEFRAKQAAMFDALHNSDKELWAQANQALADCEREGSQK